MVRISSGRHQARSRKPLEILTEESAIRASVHTTEPLGGRPPDAAGAFRGAEAQPRGECTKTPRLERRAC